MPIPLTHIGNLANIICPYQCAKTVLSVNISPNLEGVFLVSDSVCFNFRLFWKDRSSRRFQSFFKELLTHTIGVGASTTIIFGWGRRVVRDIGIEYRFYDNGK